MVRSPRCHHHLSRPAAGEASDLRDQALLQRPFAPCPGGGAVVPVAGAGAPGQCRVLRNPVFACNPRQLTSGCVVYSAGEPSELSLEAGLSELGASCAVHVFSGSSAAAPSPANASRFGFIPHPEVIGVSNTDSVKTLSRAMKDLDHQFVDIFKVVIEAGGGGLIPSLVRTAALSKVGVIVAEFRDTAHLREGLRVLGRAGFVPVYGRRDDRTRRPYAEATAVTLINTKLPEEYWSLGASAMPASFQSQSEDMLGLAWKSAKTQDRMWDEWEEP